MRATARAFLDGLKAPWALLRRTRTSPVWPRYRRLVFRQLLATLAIMSLAAPGILSGLDLAARNPHTDIHIKGAHIVVVRKKTKLTVRTARDDEEDADDEPVKVAGASFVSAHAPRLLGLWVGLVAIYGTWIVIELVIGWLAHEFVDDVSESLSTTLGLPVRPTIRGRPPKLRIDPRRLVRRLWRQLAAAIVFASGAPLFLAVSMVPRLGPMLQTGAIAAWGLYWLLVTTAAKSDLAWRDEPPRPPWFLRLWNLLTTRVPGFRWWLPVGYGRLWDRVTRKLHGAGNLVEEAPAALLGLSVVRVLANLPILGLVLRPMFPVAVTQVLLRSREKMGAVDAA